MTKPLLRSVLAILAGYVTMVLGVTSTLAILFFVARDALPATPGPFRGPGWVLWLELGCGLAAAVLGGYVCALVARRRELLHAVVLGGFALLLGLIGSGAEAGLKPQWSSIAIAIVGAIGPVLGARLRLRHTALLR
jgi:hypothetical protein